MFVYNKYSLLRALGATLLLACNSVPAFAHQALSTEPVVISAAQVTVTGTVAELSVKNQVTGVTLRYFGLKLDQGGSYALAGTILDTLSNGSRINATGTLAGNLFKVSLFSVVAQTQSLGRVTALAETRKTVSGTLAVFHKDFFEEGRGEYGLAVRDASDKPTQLNVAAIPDSLAIGMLINAEGKVAADGASLDVSTITILAPPAAKAGDIAAAPITNNVLVLPIKFTDTGGEPFSVAAINTEFQNKVAPYYQEVSYGQQLLNVTVANSGGSWLNAGVATPACDYLTIGTLADAAATAAGYNVNSYQNRYYVMPSIGCGWAGLAYVGWGRAWSNGVNALWVYGHELGHNFGLLHAGAISCGAQVLGGTCSVSEYGDPFDVMGNIRQMHFNTKQKSLLNWIPASSVKVHSSGTQTYQLSPLEVGGQATYAIKIPTSNVNRTYWVEFRQPIGFDTPISTLPNLGAQIRVGGPQFDYPCCSGGDDTQLLDMKPGGNFDDATLLQGQNYVDSTTGVAINVISASPGASGLLTVSIAMAGKTVPTTTLATSANPSPTGTSVTLTATVAGNAPSGTVAFTDGGSAISGCGAVALSGGGNSPIAACSTASLALGSHNLVATYGGDGNNTGSASSALAQVVYGGSGSVITWYNSASGQKLLWLMNGGTLVGGSMLLTDLNFQITKLGDFNGDGGTDLIWRNASTGDTVQWLMNGATVTGGATLLSNTAWSVTAVGDFNGDGKTDLLWRNSVSGEVVMWLMNGTTVIGGATLLADPNWLPQFVADFNGDGKADILWRHATTGQTVMWLMNGSTFISGGQIMSDPAWVATHVADFNGDGKSDILWRHATTGQTVIWLMNGGTLITGGLILSDPAWIATHVADLNGDGKADILWRNSSTGVTAAWLMNGMTLIGGGGLLGPPWQITRTGDFNSDHKADILWTNPSTGAKVMWLMNGQSPTAGYLLSNDPNWSLYP